MIKYDKHYELDELYGRVPPGRRSLKFHLWQNLDCPLAKAEDFEDIYGPVVVAILKPVCGRRQ